MANVELILLQRVEKLGQMGEIVKVKPGYARNYLLPQSKAVRATKANRERFERERSQLEAQNIKRRDEAERVAERIHGLPDKLPRPALGAEVAGDEDRALRCVVRGRAGAGHDLGAAVKKALGDCRPDAA